jgi:hypothetical protein
VAKVPVRQRCPYPRIRDLTGPPAELFVTTRLDTAIGWGRYGELYDYDTATDQITADPAAEIFAPAGG